MKIFTLFFIYERAQNGNFHLREAVSTSLKGDPRLAWGMEEERRTLEGKRRRPRTLEASLVLAPSRGRRALDKDWVWSLAAAQAISVRRSAQVSGRGCEKILRKSRVFSGFDNCCKIGRLFVIGLQFISASTGPVGPGLVGSGR